MNHSAKEGMKRANRKLEWRNKVQELLVKGNSQYDIAKTLQPSQPTISRDIQFLRLADKEDLMVIRIISTRYLSHVAVL